jgi:hypothetical protein
MKRKFPKSRQKLLSECGTLDGELNLAPSVAIVRNNPRINLIFITPNKKGKIFTEFE